MKTRLGIAPIAWWNDDLAELSDDESLEECLRQASDAGFAGEAEQDPGKAPPAEMTRVGHKELGRGMQAAGYEVVQ